MNKVIKRKWLKALRSGEYKQGRGRLLTCNVEGDNPKFCCLGVLTDLYIKAHKTKKWQFEQLSNTDTIKMRGVLHGQGAYLPSTVAKWAQIEVGRPRNASSVNAVLCGQNDDLKWSFKKIAAWIEKEL